MHPASAAGKPTRARDRRVDHGQPPAGPASGTPTEARTLAAARRQVSRLGNPLVNEVIVPIGEKDLWNSRRPPTTSVRLLRRAAGARQAAARAVPGRLPEPGGATSRQAAGPTSRRSCSPGSRPGCPGFQNYTGPVQADMLRLNMAIPPDGNPNNLGLLGGDVAGFPNGRRVFDDVMTIELRAIAGATYPLVDSVHAGRGGPAIADGRDVHERDPRGPGQLPVPRRPVQRVVQRPAGVVTVQNRAPSSTELGRKCRARHR